jgi:RimJ/RimL family protein N-acetyltransferase
VTARSSGTFEVQTDSSRDGRRCWERDARKDVAIDKHFHGDLEATSRGEMLRGKGIATRALSEFLGQIAARPLYARVAKHNFASIRVLEKCGFTVAGEDKASSSAGDDVVEELVMRLDAP